MAPDYRERNTGTEWLTEKLQLSGCACSSCPKCLLWSLACRLKALLFSAPVFTWSGEPHVGRQAHNRIPTPQHKDNDNSPKTPSHLAGPRFF